MPVSSFAELAVEALFIAAILAGEEATQFRLLLRRRLFEGYDKVDQGITKDQPRACSLGRFLRRLFLIILFFGRLFLRFLFLFFRCGTGLDERHHHVEKIIVAD